MNWESKRIAVVAAKWNSFVTDPMLEGAQAALKGKGITDDHIYTFRCPGSYELPLACKMCIDKLNVDGVVAIGAVIQGGTPHFHYVCDAVNKGISELNIRYDTPVSFGVLTTDTVEQAMERASIDKGNKGAEAALAVCDMIELENSITQTE
ncbi:6,7-dimethyl-8-ribityllumazine synthase [Rhodohalobacter sp. 8-1]|uniref:6,7-dimethyl-8-ribityllumazine synthase n=1 Tax=Rhodohalobacter sp. 8-1 TaxID=3131972 RepID=UPI0030EB8268